MRSFGRESIKGSLEFEGKLRDQTLRQLQTRRWPDGCGKGWLPCSLLLGLPEDFDLHDDESFKAMIRILKRTAATRPRAEFLNMAQAFGISPDVDSIIWDDAMMEIANPASGIYWGLDA